jgi:hypothetical protein
VRQSPQPGGTNVLPTGDPATEQMTTEHRRLNADY